MILIPAIDIKNNNCIRLKQGNFKKIKTFYKNPLDAILYWYNNGANRIHLVDLDGAIHGKPKNINIIKKILKFSKINSIKIQLGGGIRNIKDIEFYLKLGVSKIILGSSIINNNNFLKEVYNNFHKNIIIGLDIKNKSIAVNGWSKLLNLNIKNLINNILDCGFNEIIYTDILRDGMMKGINMKNIKKILNLNIPSIFISGGISNIKDIKNICKLNKKNIKGLICGKSLYEGILNFKKTQKYINNYKNLC